MNTELSVVGSKVINTVCFIFVNFDSVLIVLKAETAFSVLFIDGFQTTFKGGKSFKFRQVST